MHNGDSFDGETNWYVITGGPCCGKTTTINHLGALGHSIIPEAARIYIDEGVSKGLTLDEMRTDKEMFQKNILRLNSELESRHPSDRLTFLDRSAVDNLAYSRLHGVNLNGIIESLCNRRYKGVFLLDRLPFQKDYARHEDDAMAAKVHGVVRDAYVEMGYKPVDVPVMPVSERTKFILDTVEAMV